MEMVQHPRTSLQQVLLKGVPPGQVAPLPERSGQIVHRPERMWMLAESEPVNSNVTLTDHHCRRAALAQLGCWPAGPRAAVAWECSVQHNLHTTTQTL